MTFCSKRYSMMATELWGHYCYVIMGANASQITSLTVVYSTVYSGADQRKHKSSTSLAFVRGIHRIPMNSPHKWQVTRKMFPFDDVIMRYGLPRCYGTPMPGVTYRHHTLDHPCPRRTCTEIHSTCPRRVLYRRGTWRFHIHRWLTTKQPELSNYHATLDTREKMLP